MTTVTISETIITVAPTGTGAIITTAPASAVLMVASGATDHGALTGLADNDHPQYALLAAANTLTLGPDTFQTGGAANKGIIIRGAASQSANLQEWQDSGSTALAYVNNLGQAVVDRLGINKTEFTRSGSSVGFQRYLRVATPAAISIPFGTFGGFTQLMTADVNGTIQGNGNASVNVYGLSFGVDITGSDVPVDYIGGITGYAYSELTGTPTVQRIFGMFVDVENYAGGTVVEMLGIDVYTANYAGSVTTSYGVRVQSDDGNTSVITRYGAYIASQIGAHITNPYALWTDGGHTRHKAGAAIVVPLSLQAAASQSADLLRLLSSDGTTILHRYNKGGYWVTSRHSAPADADLSAGDMALWFDQTNGAAKLMIKAKEAGGTVRTGSVNLA